MRLRPEIQFCSGFPDDSVEDDTDFVVWPGRNIAEALKAGLEQKGYRVSEPIDAQEHGWELDIWRGQKRLWAQVSVIDSEENYLITQNMTFFLWPDRKLFRQFLLDLQEVIQAEPRFREVKWFEKAGISANSPPGDGPVAD